MSTSALQQTEQFSINCNGLLHGDLVHFKLSNNDFSKWRYIKLDHDVTSRSEMPMDSVSFSDISFKIHLISSKYRSS